LTLRIEPLDSTAVRQGFCSGCEPLDRYFVEQVGQDVRRGITACFAAKDANGNLVGFYTLASCGIPVVDLPDSLRKKLPRYPTVPGVLLGRLAISMESQGMGLGSVLLFDALKRCIASEIAVYALVVDAIDDRAGRFYGHFGFLPFPDRSDRFFLPLATARKLFVST
jgi:predicted GNAT family N-acyltransferase